MKGRNIVFIAKSLDGYIADKDGGLDWLNIVPNPEGKDLGYNALIDQIDAIVMGRVTFETVIGFGIDWPYEKIVFVASNTLKEVPGKYKGKVEFISGTPRDIVETINGKGYANLYIDGGKTVQGFLEEDLIDEMIITTMPVLLGGGFPLFGELSSKLIFSHTRSDLYLKQIVQDHYERVR